MDNRLFVVLQSVEDVFFNNESENIIIYLFLEYFNLKSPILLRLRECHIEGNWLDDYSEYQFYRFFRMTRKTFQILLNVIIENDKYKFMEGKYTGGHFPVEANKSLLIFLYFMAHQDTLNSISTRFKVADCTVMNICNEILYILLRVRGQYIFWPRTPDEFAYIENQFQRYPGVIGAIDGCHIHIKVPHEQQDSYIDRYMQRSVNLLAICTAEKVFTYIFVGFPGSAHDARVLANSELCLQIERHGKHTFFPDERYHLIGDSAFPIKTWLMKPYRNRPNMPRLENIHNKCLSADRVCIENTFGILKGRWRRLIYINTYCVRKANEIITGACILHNFTYLNNDPWQGEIEEIEQHNEEDVGCDQNREEFIHGQEKRNDIAASLIRQL